MRVLSKYGQYKIQVRPQVTEAYATGQTKIIQSALVASFSLGEVNAEERAIARARFAFNGFYQEEDMVSVVEPDYRISAFDSLKAQTLNHWSDEEREQVEHTLRRSAERLPQDLIVMEEEKLDPPWPTYDSFPGTQAELLTKIDEDGFDLQTVLNYERENQNRDKLVAAMEKALAVDAALEPEEELVVG